MANPKHAYFSPSDALRRGATEYGLGNHRKCLVTFVSPDPEGGGYKEKFPDAEYVGKVTKMIRRIPSDEVPVIGPQSPKL